MYRANDNLGLYQELNELIHYIPEAHENRLDELIVKFRNEGLTRSELNEGIVLINDYLPAHIECNAKGCYFAGPEVVTPIPEISDDLPVIDLVLPGAERQLVTV